jgi:hypothetical protein
MLVTVPIGLWVFSFICDLVFTNPGVEYDRLLRARRWSVGCGDRGRPGLVDGVFLRKTPIFRTVLLHMALALFATLMFVMSLLSLDRGAVSWSLMLYGGYLGAGVRRMARRRARIRPGLGVEPQAEGRHGWPTSSREANNLRRMA